MGLKDKWWNCWMASTHFADPWNVPQLTTTKIHIWQLNKIMNLPKLCCQCFLYFLLDELDELQRLIIWHFFFQPLLTRFNSKFDMREAYCLSLNDVYKNSSSSRIEKEWLGNVSLSLKIFNDQILDPFFADTFPSSLNSAGREAGSFPDWG